MGVSAPWVMKYIPMSITNNFPSYLILFLPIATHRPVNALNMPRPDVNYRVISDQIATEGTFNLRNVHINSYVSKDAHINNVNAETWTSRRSQTSQQSV